MSIPRSIVAGLSILASSCGGADDGEDSSSPMSGAAGSAGSDAAGDETSAAATSGTSAGAYAHCPENPRNQCTVEGVGQTPLFNAYVERTGCPPRLCGSTDDCLSGEACVTPDPGQGNGNCLANYECQDAEDANGETICQCGFDPVCDASYCDEV